MPGAKAMTDLADAALAAIEAKARAATKPGVWRAGSHVVMSGEEVVTSDVYEEADAAYIAAMSPDVALALVDELRRLREIIGSCEQCGTEYEPTPPRYCPHCKVWAHYEGRTYIRPGLPGTEADAVSDATREIERLRAEIARANSALRFDDWDEEKERE